MNNTKIFNLCCAAMLPVTLFAAQPEKPNVVLIMTDQQRASLCGREGFPLEVTPFADRMGGEGIWFSRAYTTAPASTPARTSFLTGRWPKATRVESNHNTNDAVFEGDLMSTARKMGYRTAMVGKNHTCMTPDDVDYWRPYDHSGQGRNSDGEPGATFDKYLLGTAFYADLEPAPFGAEVQQPTRMVDDALAWIARDDEKPFVMWLSFAEPHNPYQTSEPYYSMFPPEKLPPTLSGLAQIDLKGERYRHLHEIMSLGHTGYYENLERLRSIYLGMIRLLDDQMARFVGSLKQSGVYENTVFVILADHGDYAGEYGLMKKGVGMSDAIARIPMVWFGSGVAKTGHSDAHVSIADIFPTVCEAIGAEIPMGVQGRSLYPMLSGKPYPKDEFRSVMVQDGYGGQYYTTADATDYKAEGLINDQPYFFDELNTWTQSGSARCVRMGDWKLEFDMTGRAWMYNLAEDPVELENRWDNPRYAAEQGRLLAELLKWEIATNDPLPVPQSRYRFKRYPHNYLFVPQ